MLFNAVPLLVLAALYLAVGVRCPALWREPASAAIGFASALLFPCLGVAAASSASRSLVDAGAARRPPWLSLPAILLAALPLVAFARNWRDRGRSSPGPRRREAEQHVAPRPRAGGVGRLSRRLLDADRAGCVAQRAPGRARRACSSSTSRTSRSSRTTGGGRGSCRAREGGGDNELLLGQSSTSSGSRPASARPCARPPPSRSTTPRARRSSASG